MGLKMRNCTNSLDIRDTTEIQVTKTILLQWDFSPSGSNSEWRSSLFCSSASSQVRTGYLNVSVICANIRSIESHRCHEFFSLLSTTEFLCFQFITNTLSSYSIFIHLQTFVLVPSVHSVLFVHQLNYSQHSVKCSLLFHRVDVLGYFGAIV